MKGKMGEVEEFFAQTQTIKVKKRKLRTESQWTKVGTVR